MSSKVGRCYDILVIIASYLHPNSDNPYPGRYDLQSYNDLLSFLLVGREAQAAAEKVLYETSTFPVSTECSPRLFLESLQKHSRQVAALVQTLDLSEHPYDTSAPRIRELCVNVKDLTVDETEEIVYRQAESAFSVLRTLTIVGWIHDTIDDIMGVRTFDAEKVALLAISCKHLEFKGIVIEWSDYAEQVQSSIKGQQLTVEALSFSDCAISGPVFQCMFEPWKGYITRLRIENPSLDCLSGVPASDVPHWQRLILLFRDTLKELDVGPSEGILTGFSFLGFEALECLDIYDDWRPFPIPPQHLPLNLRRLSLNLNIGDAAVDILFRTFQAPTFLPKLDLFPAIWLCCPHSYQYYRADGSPIICGCEDPLKGVIQKAVAAFQQRGLVKPSISDHFAGADA